MEIDKPSIETIWDDIAERVAPSNPVFWESLRSHIHQHLEDGSNKENENIGDGTLNILDEVIRTVEDRWIYNDKVASGMAKKLSRPVLKRLAEILGRKTNISDLGSLLELYEDIVGVLTLNITADVAMLKEYVRTMELLVEPEQTPQISTRIANLLDSLLQYQADIIYKLTVNENKSIYMILGLTTSCSDIELKRRYEHTMTVLLLESDGSADVQLEKCRAELQGSYKEWRSHRDAIESRKKQELEDELKKRKMLQEQLLKRTKETEEALDFIEAVSKTNRVICTSTRRPNPYYVLGYNPIWLRSDQKNTSVLRDIKRRLVMLTHPDKVNKELVGRATEVFAMVNEALNDAKDPNTLPQGNLRNLKLAPWCVGIVKNEVKIKRTPKT